MRKQNSKARWNHHYWGSGWARSDRQGTERGKRARKVEAGTMDDTFCNVRQRGESLTMRGGMRRKNGYMRGKNGNQEGRMERKSNGESYPLYIAKQQTTWERRGQHGMKGGSLTKREYETASIASFFYARRMMNRKGRETQRTNHKRKFFTSLPIQYL